MRDSMSGLKQKQSLFFSLMLVMVSLCISAGPSSAEQRPDPMMILYCSSEDIGFTGEFYTAVQFSRHRHLVDELKLNKSQLEKLNEAEKQFNAGLKQWLDEQRTPPSAPPHKDVPPRMVNKEAAKLVNDSRKKVAEILKPDQLKRMRNFWLQLYGLWIIPGKDLQELLRLTTTQEKNIDLIRAQVFRNINDASDKPVRPKSPEQCKVAVINNDRLFKMVKQGEQSALEVLTPEQRNILEKIKGKPFKPEKNPK